MKPIKLGLRIWIAITSIISFLGGWMLFSHAGKPAPLITAQPSTSQSSQMVMPTLPPVPSIEQLTNGSSNGGSALQPLPSIQFSAPSIGFRTRGS
jgi:hypothetical protein